MFKDKLIELRKQNNDTQESLAKKLNVSRSLVAKWEQNRAYPSNEDLDNIAKIYSVNYEELMSDKELKKIYGIVLKNSKKKNLIIMILSMVFSLLTIILVIINLIPNKKYIYMEKNEVNTKLIKYKGTMNGVEYESDFVGESEYNNFMKNENFYTWERFQMYRYKLTDKSSIYYFHYMANFVPGYFASINNDEEYDENAVFNEIDITISLSNNNIFPIYSWPNKLGGSKIYESKYSSNYIFQDIETMHGVSLKNIDDKIILAYDSSDDLLSIIMNNTYESQELNFHQSFSMFYSNWNYKAITEASKKTMGSFQMYYMFEVNESETNEFNFKVDKKVISESKNKLTVTNHITEYNCNISQINESV